MSEHKSIIPQPSAAALWSFDEIHLRTTFRTCICGAQHSNIEVFEYHTTPVKFMDRNTIATRLIPINTSYMPNRPIRQITRNIPLAVCPRCIDRYSSRISYPIISEEAWKATLRKKEDEELSMRRQKKAEARLREITPSLDDLGL